MDIIKTAPGADPIIVEGYFSATPEQVFRAFTVPEQVMKWFGPRPNSLHSATIDLRQGGAWCFLEVKNSVESIGFEGKYLDIASPERLAFTWSRFTLAANGQRESTENSQVEITFRANGNGTDMRVVHAAMQSEYVRKQFAAGWRRGVKSLNSVFSKTVNNDAN